MVGKCDNCCEKTSIFLAISSKDKRTLSNLLFISFCFSLNKFMSTNLVESRIEPFPLSESELGLDIRINSPEKNSIFFIMCCWSALIFSINFWSCSTLKCKSFSVSSKALSFSLNSPTSNLFPFFSKLFSKVSRRFFNSLVFNSPKISLIFFSKSLVRDEISFNIFNCSWLKVSWGELLLFELDNFNISISYCSSFIFDSNSTIFSIIVSSS